MKHMVVARITRDHLSRRLIRKIEEDKKEADPVNNHAKEYNRLSTKLVASLAKYTKHKASYKKTAKSLNYSTILVSQKSKGNESCFEK